NFDAIKSLKIIIPPIKRQNSFVSFVEQVDKSKVAVQKSLDETQKLYDSLMQEYFG
ncbi:restriction endonuclease subunit S, partial [Lactobacillus johnsonii]|nr:restriction endonuclease subunit S [Lactobacillus johnsonii]